MIDYTTWCAIRDGLAKHLGVRQVARDLGLNVKTVRRWRARPYAPRATVPRPSKLDPFKGRIVGWLDAHPLSAQQVFQPKKSSRSPSRAVSSPRPGTRGDEIPAMPEPVIPAAGAIPGR